MTRDAAVGGADAGERPNGDLVTQLQSMWESRDPVPPDLATRLCFALELEDLEVELARLDTEFGLVGARSEEEARTLTFTSASLSVMITLGDAPGGAVRLDGWIGDGGGLRVLLRRDGSDFETTSDGDGRFVFDAVPRGLTQLVFRSDDGSALQLARPVVTPAVKL
jgi:hypothetical protein